MDILRLDDACSASLRGRLLHLSQQVIAPSSCLYPILMLDMDNPFVDLLCRPILWKTVFSFAPRREHHQCSRSSINRVFDHPLENVRGLSHHCSIVPFPPDHLRHFLRELKPTPILSGSVRPNGDSLTAFASMTKRYPCMGKSVEAIRIIRVLSISPLPLA